MTALRHRLPLLLLAPLLWLALALALPAQESDLTVFEVDSFNSGMPEPADGVDRSTPQSTMESFFAFADDDDWAQAAQLLDLSEIPEDAQPQSGAQLAQMLRDILKRKVLLDWADLVDRPDAMLTRGQSDDPLVGVARRSILLDVLDLRDHPVELRLDRVQPPEGDPVWVVSRRSVRDLPGLHRLYGPTELELQLPESLRQETVAGLMVWELIGLPLVILAAALAGWAASRLLKLAARHTPGFVARGVIRAIRWPLIVFIVTWVISVTTQSFFVFSGQVELIIGPLTIIGYTVAALLFLLNGVDAILDRIAPLDGMQVNDAREGELRAYATRITTVRRVLIVIIVIVGFGVVLSQTELFRGFGLSILASAGALTLIFGFAARQVLGNILASLQITLNQSARIGDKILYNDQLCYVERINFTYVQLKIWTGERLVVPVSEFISEPFQNWVMGDVQMVRLIPLKFAHDADVGAMRDAFFEIIDDLDPDELQDRDAHKVMVTGHDVFGMEATFCLACANADTAWTLACTVRERLLARGTEMQQGGAHVFPDANPAEGA
ncbi:mechanosensitive ion channel family protein [Pseudoroseicyclus tamaricis]|uniref:Mechanosensitive ion channel n=1 Tax=Pseudoroseicyclus tamaricis TaxID=2705421 RepID=A0A6B2JYT9_9RHOB|nr:mechanosensitive ion channel domain-containing protein [Pseudoroseicyclus tamaricis]NDV01464.1 mechanosensitive ion channel [Pseudoroseicyclus tamaricis]